MSTPYVGQITMFGGNFAPRNFAFCNGQTIQISQNEALYTLIGTTYGGDGQTNFLLPNMMSRLPVHFGTGTGLSTYVLGQAAGANSVTLSVSQLPQHNHPLFATTANATQATLDGNFPATPTTGSPPTLYASGNGLTAATLAQTAVAPAGQNQSHDNMMPSLAISFIIALYGIFPSRN